MSQFKDLVISGSMRVLGTLLGKMAGTLTFHYIDSSQSDKTYNGSSSQEVN